MVGFVYTSVKQRILENSLNKVNKKMVHEEYKNRYKRWDRREVAVF